jgi:hypothetical protein
VTSLRAAPFALWTGLLPFACVHLSYLLAASQGHVDWCVPYWDSCTSISATGRELPEKLLFKLVMMPAGLCAAGFWWLVQAWLRAVHAVQAPAIFRLGATAALFLLLYVAALGEGNDYRWARQSGIILFFSLSYLAQLCFLYRLAQHCNPARGSEWWVFRCQQASALLLLAIGITSILLDLGYAQYDSIEDAFEWVMMLFIVIQFCSHYFLWRDSDLRIGIVSVSC